MRTKSLLIAMGFVLGLSSAPARADWSADIKVHAVQGGQTHNQTGKAYGKPQKMRFEIEMQGQSTMIIADMKLQKAWMTVGGTTMAMSMDKMAFKTPSCESNDIDSCLLKQGFKKTGSEKANGHPCTIYEKLENGATIRLWRPTDLKDAPLARQVTLKDGVEQNRVEFTNIKTAKLADSLFAAPKGEAMDMSKLQAEAMKDPEAFKRKMLEMQKQMQQQRGGDGQ